MNLFDFNFQLIVDSILLLFIIIPFIIVIVFLIREYKIYKKRQNKKLNDDKADIDI